jgi:hypothetical protein
VWVVGFWQLHPRLFVLGLGLLRAVWAVDWDRMALVVPVFRLVPASELGMLLDSTALELRTKMEESVSAESVLAILRVVERRRLCALTLVQAAGRRERSSPGLRGRLVD